MKKIVILLLIPLLLTGCSYNNKLEIKRFDNYSYNQIMDKILKLNIKNFNKVGKGYKYYAPKGVVLKDSTSNNDVLLSSNNKYYLYVDVVSYYYKNEVNYPDDNNYFYYKKLNYNNKKGYIIIDEEKNGYYIKMLYNYSVVESHVKKSDLNLAMKDISYILSSMRFNDSLLNKMYEEGTLSSKEEVYKLFDNKEKEGNFLEYIKEYDNYDEDELILEETTTSTISSTTSTSN